MSGVLPLRKFTFLLILLMFVFSGVLYKLNAMVQTVNVGTTDSGILLLSWVSVGW